VSQAHELANQRIVVLGLARQGIALARFLAEQGAQVTVSDVKTEDQLAEAIQSLDGLSIQYVLGGHPVELLDGCDRLCLSGGVPVDLPIVVEAQKRGIELANDAQILVEQCEKRAQRVPIIGITGSAGKTTTTALTGEMLKAAGFKTWVGGNIGNPLIADASIQAGGLMVITGKGYGMTNIIALDRAGAVILEKTVAVEGPGDDVVVVYRGVDRATYSCLPDCEQRFTLGDSDKYFESTSGQVSSRDSLARGQGIETKK